MSIRNLAVLGAQWGDEGKGKIVDLLSPSFAVVARSQGGHNGDPCPAWHHDTSRAGFLNYYVDTFAFRILVFSLWKATTSTNAWLADS